MLNLQYITTKSDINISVDPYVPLTVEAGGSTAEPKLYWRAVPDPGTLLEVGMDLKTGRWRSFTLTAIPSKSVKIVEVPPADTAEQDMGTPMFSVAKWNGDGDYAGRFRDEPVQVEILVAPHSCHVLLGHEQRPRRTIRVGPIAFLFDEQDALVRVDLFDLSASDVEMLSGFAYNGAPRS